MKKRRIFRMVLMVLSVMLLTACSKKPGIEVIGSGEAYEVNDRCRVLETYEKYNIQTPVEQVAEELTKEEVQGLVFKLHEVVATDDTTSEDGRYDAVDTINITVTGADPLGVFPQTIAKTVEYKRDAESLKWIVANETCTKWDINYRKIGGTAWKKSSQEEEVYIRFSDTIEFFYTKVQDASDGTQQANFNTTITGAIATVKDGEVSIKRIHITSGKMTVDGTVTLILIDGEEVVLNEFMQIEKADLPFSEEEYRVLVDI